MKVEIETSDKTVSEYDVKMVTVNDQIRAVVLHHKNGLVESINLDFVKKFTVPSEAIHF